MTGLEETSEYEVTPANSKAEADKELLACMLFLFITIVFIAAGYMVYHAVPSQHFFLLGLSLCCIGLICASFVVRHFFTFLAYVRISKKF